MPKKRDVKPQKGDPGTKVVIRGGKEYVYCVETFVFEGKQYDVTGPTRQKAIINADRKKVALENGHVGISKNMSVKRWADEWFQTYKKPTVKSEKYLRDIQRHIKLITASIGSMRIWDVTDIDLQQILNSRAGMSHSEAKHLRDTMKAIFKRARQTKKNGAPLIKYDPSEALEMPQTTEGKRRSLTEYERMHMYNCMTHKAAPMFFTSLLAGLRPQEVRALSFNHLHFDKRVIEVREAMKSGTKDIGDTKTDAGVRWVPLCDELHEILVALKGSPFDPVFTQETTGRRHTESSYYKAWRSFKKAMNISMGAKLYRNKLVLSVIDEEIDPYYLRHTYCTDLRDAGVDLTKAAELMGHDDISVTANIYTHKMSEDERVKVSDLINQHQKDTKQRIGAG